MMRRRRKSRPTPVEDILAEVLARTGLREGLDDRRLVDAWADVVGPDLADRSRAVSLRDGILTVEADHGVWRQELTLLFPRILERYRQIYGAERVRELRWDRQPGGRPRRGS